MAKESKAPAKAERIVTIELWKPATLVIAEICFLWWVRREAAANVGKDDIYADPIYVPVIMNVFYLSMIFFGKRYMATREPFNIKTWMFAYNLFQAIMNLIVLIGFFYEVHTTGMRIWRSGVDRSAKGLGLGFWLYTHYHNKYLEFADTTFMILRRKFNQISFLHVYHHSLLTWSWWAVTTLAPGGDAWFGAAYNSFIHVLMYSYYLCSTFGIRCPWKKVLTQMQMIQFCACFTHAVYLFMLDEDVYPRELIALQAFVMVNMLVLFGNFYRKQYTKETEAKAPPKVVESPPCDISAVQPSPPASPMASGGPGSFKKND